MKNKDKRSFFEKLTGTINIEDENQEVLHDEETETEHKNTDWNDDDNEEGQLTVDVYQTNDAIIIQTMVAGVRPEDLNISITRDMVTIKGMREEPRGILEENYFYKELYWGSFSRTILLPQEIEPEQAEATERHGLLMLKLPKIDKNKTQTIRVKSVQ